MMKFIDALVSISYFHEKLYNYIIIITVTYYFRFYFSFRVKRQNQFILIFMNSFGSESLVHPAVFTSEIAAWYLISVT